MSGIVDDILECTDDILGLRDDLGVIKDLVYILTRVWPGKKGVGNPVDSLAPILPTPYLVDLSHSLRLREGGLIKQGDILVKHISKQSYATEDLIDCTVEDDKTEKFYYFGGRLYSVISVEKEYVYWNVQVRKTSKTKVYL